MMAPLPTKTTLAPLGQPIEPTQPKKSDQTHSLRAAGRAEIGLRPFFDFRIFRSRSSDPLPVCRRLA